MSAMANPLDSWTREYDEASKLADEINTIITESKTNVSIVRRKITILGARLDGLESLLSMLPGQQKLTSKELNKCQDMLTNLRSKAKQLSSAISMANFANRDDLVGPAEKPSDNMERIAGLDNNGVVRLQRHMIKEQDESLEKLAQSVVSTKHIALAVNEELDLHTRLIDSLDQQVDSTASRLQRVQKRLVILNKKMRGGCSCGTLMLAVISIIILALTAWMLIKYL